jgi:hypothetical protein
LNCRWLQFQVQPLSFNHPPTNQTKSKPHQPPQNPPQVTDNLGFTSTADVSITITAPNAALQAKISSPIGFVVQNQNANTSVLFDGRQSVGLPGRPVQQYSWEVRTAPANTDPSFLVTAFGAQAQVALPVGQYNLTLRVSDGTGLSSVASQNFIIGAGRSDGLIAVISQPNSWLPAPGGGSQVTVNLDAAGSQPSPGNKLTQWVWAVITLPDKAPITNTSGPSTSVTLPEGEYQVGLLAIDSSGDNAIAKKNFTIGGAGSGGGGGGSSGPIIPPGLIVTGPAGGQGVITGVTDPEGGAVQLEWTIDPDGQAIPGQGTVVSLRNLTPGDYILAIVARGPSGASTNGRATLRVSQGSAPPGPDSGLSLRLPSLTLSAGSSIVLDAGATGIPPPDRGNFTYSWALSQKASGTRMDSAADAVARFNLTKADSYQLQLQATDKKTGAISSATSNVRVLARADPQLPLLATGGKCGPFTSGANADTKISCPDLKVVATDGTTPYTDLTYAWRVTNIKTGAVKTGIGREFNAGRCVHWCLSWGACWDWYRFGCRGAALCPADLFVTSLLVLHPYSADQLQCAVQSNHHRLTEGDYVVELAVGAFGQSPKSENTLLFLSTTLLVSRRPRRARWMNSVGKQPQQPKSNRPILIQPRAFVLVNQPPLRLTPPRLHRAAVRPSSRSPNPSPPPKRAPPPPPKQAAPPPRPPPRPRPRRRPPPSRPAAAAAAAPPSRQRRPSRLRRPSRRRQLSRRLGSWRPTCGCTQYPSRCRGRSPAPRQSDPRQSDRPCRLSGVRRLERLGC